MVGTRARNERGEMVDIKHRKAPLNLFNTRMFEICCSVAIVIARFWPPFHTLNHAKQTPDSRDFVEAPKQKPIVIILCTSNSDVQYCSIDSYET